MRFNAWTRIMAIVRKAQRKAVARIKAPPAGRAKVPTAKVAKAAKPAPPPFTMPQTPEQLLLLFCTPAQRKEWKTKGHVTIKGTDGHTYTVGKHPKLRHYTPSQTFVWVQRSGATATGVMGLMPYPYANLPIIDFYIAQLLNLRADDRAMRNIACGRGFLRPR